MKDARVLTMFAGGMTLLSLDPTCAPKSLTNLAALVNLLR
jgi:hypothetical protein